MQHLQTAAGYQPTDWEARHITRQQGCQDAAGTLACPRCGCTSHHDSDSYDCGVRWDPDQDKPVQACGYSCGQHRAWQDQDRRSATGHTWHSEPGGDEDD